MFKFLLLIIPLFFLACGSSGSSAGGSSSGTGDGSQDNNHNSYIEVPESSPCKNGEFYRIKTKECVMLKHPTWGFKGFDVPKENVYTLQTCTEEALRTLLNNVPVEGGKVILPECTITVNDTIGLYDNIIFEGAGIGKTIISDSNHDIVSLRGKNIIVRDMTLEGNEKALGGVVGTHNQGNILIENIEIKNLTGSGVYLVTEPAQENSKITIRQNTISNTLHGIMIRTEASAKILIYSNNIFNNKEYGIDISTTSDVEVSGNYLHDNYYAGAKSPVGDRIYYYYNDINYNGKADDLEQRAGIVYMLSRPSAQIFVEYNDLSNNGGPAFAGWSGHFAYLLLRNNIVTGSQDSNGYNIKAVGIDKIDVYGDNGRIWVGEGNKDKIEIH